MASMKTVNVAELKNHLSAYLNEVKAGREIVVRDRHTPIARILPIERGADEDEELRLLAAQGQVRLGNEPLDESFWDLPAPRVPAHLLKRAIEIERDGR